VVCSWKGSGSRPRDTARKLTPTWEEVNPAVVFHHVSPLARVAARLGGGDIAILAGAVVDVALSGRLRDTPSDSAYDQGGGGQRW
jgi:hypothetical protein